MRASSAQENISWSPRQRWRISLRDLYLINAIFRAKHILPDAQTTVIDPGRHPQGRIPEDRLTSGGSSYPPGPPLHDQEDRRLSD
ncbi:MAG: hypothetical protein MZU79_01005 [Anaerotruncus sp.]|nr:hypothetical protein [Anaerotruncus sp.]